MDTCDEELGCFPPINCTAADVPCGAVVGCFESSDDSSEAGCKVETISALFDVCGVCRGIGVCAIATGVVVGIVVGAVIAGLLVAFFSKRGYDYYKLRGDNLSAGANTNPAFQANTNVGNMPGAETAAY